MSEYLNTQGSPVFKEDASDRSLHISDLSPTSELLLSPFHDAPDAYRVHTSYEKGTNTAPTDFYRKRIDLSSTNSGALVSLASQYNDDLKTAGTKSKVNHRKAFSHEKLFSEAYKPSITTCKPRDDFAKEDVTSGNSYHQISHTFTRGNPSYRNTKPSSNSVEYDEGLPPSSSRTNDLNNNLSNQHYVLNGDRYGSIIAKSNVNGSGYTRGRNARMNRYDSVTFRDTVHEKEYVGQILDSDTNDFCSGNIVQGKVNGNGSGGENMNSAMNGNDSYNAVSNKNVDNNSYGGTILHGQKHNTKSSGKNTGDMILNGNLGNRSSPNDGVNRKPLGESNFGHNVDGLPSSEGQNILDYGNFLLGGHETNREVTLTVSEDSSKSGKPPGVFANVPQTTEDILSQIFGRPVANHKSKVTTFSEFTENVGKTSLKRNDLIQDGLFRDPLVQTNVPNYGKLKKSENEDCFRETDAGLMQTTSGLRRGGRSKSSELPLRQNTSVSTSFGLSKSWGSSKIRQGFQAMKAIERRDECRKRPVKEISVSQRERVAKMFRIEEDMKLKRAQEFRGNKLLRKVFTAWRLRSQDVRTRADQLCKIHVLRKGMSALKYGVEYHRRAVHEFQERRCSIVLAKCWQMWQHKTRESMRKKKQQTFTQWHYYKLHMERAKLLETIANKHILSKNYSKWKARFKAKQKNSIATVHFKINLIYRYWQCWTLYTKQRRVKSHMNGIASYHYGERAQRRLFQEWRDITRKSSLAGRLARRRILLKAFFQWKHWTQYAKIVHLRLHSMCKEYHKKSLLTHMFIKWRQVLRMKRSLAFWRKNQLRRAIKLWKLRHMRKKIHKHLCKALARQARKRRFFEKWSRFVEMQKRTRFAFVNLMGDFYIRILFNCWRSEATMGATRRKSLKKYQRKKNTRVVQQGWEFWKFQMAIIALRRRCKNRRSLRCVRNCCEVWRLKVKKLKLSTMLDQKRSIWELLLIKRFFRMWRSDLEKVKVDHARALYVANILRKNSVARIFHAWRVVNQEECIIESLVKRRERKEMAKVYDAWHHYLFRIKYVRKRRLSRIEVMKSNAFVIWRQKCWFITKEREASQALLYSKLQRHFLAWMEYINDVRLTERMREKKAAGLMRTFIRTWKQNAEKKVESREREIGERAYRRILLVSFFGLWQRKTSEQSRRIRIMEGEADNKLKRFIVEKSLKRWIRQYTIENNTREHLALKRTDQLRNIFLSWKDFANDEFERQLHDFATNLALDLSAGSTFLSPSSGYQTSLKNSATSFQFLPGDEEVLTPVSAPHSRPVTPTRCLNNTQDKFHVRPVGNLPIYRPVTMDRQQSFPGYQTPPSTTGSPPGRCCSPLIRQRSLDQISQFGTSPQRSSDGDDGVQSSGVHSAGEESDQDDRTSIHITESLFSFQTTSDGTPRDRELLVTDTILHWRSLPLSVAFRSWFKYTQHMKLVATLFGNCVVRNRERMLTKMLGKWRRWLFVTVLARQHWFMHIRTKYLHAWAKYRRLQILNAQRKDEAEMFSKRFLKKRYFIKWKNKKTTKCHLQSIVVRWQKDAVVTGTEKFVIDRFQQKNQANCLRRTFLHWKKTTRHFQQATQFCEALSVRRCLDYWKGVVCYRAELKRKVNRFRNHNLMSKTFKEWRSRYEDNQTAKIILEVSEERKVGKTFKAWHAWASASNQRRKACLSYRSTQERSKLKAKFIFWLTESKKRTAVKERYEKSLLRRILKAWRYVLLIKASDSSSIQDFQKIVQRNTLQIAFAFWRKRAQQNQLLSEYLKQQAKRKVATGFELWRKRKRMSIAKARSSERLMKKMFSNWCREIFKRRMARQHFKSWHAIAEGNKELNQVADSVVHDSEKKLLIMKFNFWKNATRNIRVARYHNSTKLARRFFIEWLHFTCTQKALSSNLKAFQLSHQKNNLGLLRKYMKIWKLKSASLAQAENLHKDKISSKYWKVWRHNFVRRRVSSAMVEHDNKKTLAKIFISWYNVTASHTSLSKEVKSFRMRRWFRRWMARYNNS